MSPLEAAAAWKPWCWYCSHQFLIIQQLRNTYEGKDPETLDILDFLTNRGEESKLSLGLCNSLLPLSTTVLLHVSAWIEVVAHTSHKVGNDLLVEV